MNWVEGNEVMVPSVNAHSGWRRTMYILMVTSCIVHVSITMVPVFLPQYLQAMGVEGPENLTMWMGIIEGSTYLTMFLVLPIWGRLSDRLGYRWMVVRSVLGTTVVIFLMSLADSPWELLLLRLAEGVVAGFLPTAVTMVGASAPTRRLQYSVSMLQVGTSIGIVTGPLFGGWLTSILRDKGNVFSPYQNTFLIVAGMLALMTFVIVFALDDVEKERRAGPRGNLFWQCIQWFRHRLLRKLLVISFLVPIAVGSYLTLLSYLLQLLLSPGDDRIYWASILFSVTAIATAVASPWMGKWGDRWGSYRVFFVCSFGAALFLMGFAFAANQWMIIALSFPLGVCMAGISPSIAALLAVAAPRGEIGSVYGFQFSLDSLGRCVGPLLLGSVVVRVVGGMDGLRSVFIVAGIFSLCTCLMVLPNLFSDGNIGSEHRDRSG